MKTNEEKINKNTSSGTSHPIDNTFIYEGIEKIVIRCANLADQEKITQTLDPIFKRIHP